MQELKTVSSSVFLLTDV